MDEVNVKVFTELDPDELDVSIYRLQDVSC